MTNKLADFGVPYSTISTSNGPLSVRGLSFSDLTYLAGRYAMVFVNLYQTFPKASEDELISDFMKRPDVTEYLKTGLAEGLLTSAPALVAEIIACGADGRGDESSVAAADRLPVGLQLTLTSEIIFATLAGFEGAGKLKEIVGPIIVKALAEAKNGSPKA